MKITKGERVGTADGGKLGGNKLQMKVKSQVEVYILANSALEDDNNILQCLKGEANKGRRRVGDKKDLSGNEREVIASK